MVSYYWGTIPQQDVPVTTTQTDAGSDTKEGIAALIPFDFDGGRGVSPGEVTVHNLVFTLTDAGNSQTKYVVHGGFINAENSQHAFWGRSSIFFNFSDGTQMLAPDVDRRFICCDAKGKHGNGTPVPVPDDAYCTSSGTVNIDFSLINIVTILTSRFALTLDEG
jgi:hypothetical protein